MNFPTLINHMFHHQSGTYPLVIQSSIPQTKTNTTSHAKHITNAPYHCTIAWHSLSTVRRFNNTVGRHDTYGFPISCYRLTVHFAVPGGSVPSIQQFNSQNKVLYPTQS